MGKFDFEPGVKYPWWEDIGIVLFLGLQNRSKFCHLIKFCFSEFFSCWRLQKISRLKHKQMTS